MGATTALNDSPRARGDSTGEKIRLDSPARLGGGLCDDRSDAAGIATAHTLGRPGSPIDEGDADAGSGTDPGTRQSGATHRG